MAIIQKLIIDKSKTNQFQIIVRDETGTFTNSNNTGYGGDNGSPITSFWKYIFDIENRFTGATYRQIQSDIISNINEFHNPSVFKIANKEDVYINAENLGLSSFNDAIYNIYMNVIIDLPLEFSLNSGDVVIPNTISNITLFDKYNGILINNDIYLFTNLINDMIVLNKPISQSSNLFRPLLRTNSSIIINDNLNDCINKQIVNLISNCDPENYNLNTVNELQLLNWGLQRAIDREDYMQAEEYMLFLNKICKSYKCNC